MSEFREDKIEIVVFYQGSERGIELSESMKVLGLPATVVDDINQVRKRISSGRCDFAVIGQDDPVSVDPETLSSLIHLNQETRFLFLLAEKLNPADHFLRKAGGHLVISNLLSIRQLAPLIFSQVDLLIKERQNFRLRQMLNGRSSYDTLIGGSVPMRSLYRLLDRIARTDTNVMITGEPGTELSHVARAIHQRSERGIFPIVMVDCRRIKGQPDAAGIFGPVGKGHYQDAPCPAKSAIAKAANGVIVLENVDSLNSRGQDRLLGYLDHPFFQNETPGTPQPVPRLMVTSDSDLTKKVEDGSFLKTLYYRLNILQVRVPPLRERREDIPMLAQHFLRTVKHGGNGSSQVLSFSNRALLALFQHDWPWNVEELKTLIHELVPLQKGPQIDIPQLPASIAGEPEVPSEGKTTILGNSDLPLKEAKRIFETEYFKDLLRKTNGNMTLASRYSRVGRPYLYKKIREYGIQPDQFRTG
jgi:DNA-binding NtrC family response regulator